MGHLLEDLLLVAFERQEEHALAGDDRELSEIDRVGAFAQDLALRSLQAALREEACGVLELASGFVACEGLRGRQRFAVAREHVADPSLGNRDDRHQMDAVLERKKRMPAAA